MFEDLWDYSRRAICQSKYVFKHIVKMIYVNIDTLKKFHNEIKIYLLSFFAWSQGLWSMTLSDSHSGVSESCVGKGWFSVVSIEKLVGMESSIKCSACSSSTIGSGGPSQIGRLDSMVVGRVGGRWSPIIKMNTSSTTNHHF